MGLPSWPFSAKPTPGLVLQLFEAGGRGGDPVAVDPMQAGQAYNTAIGCVLSGPTICGEEEQPLLSHFHEKGSHKAHRGGTLK